MNRSVASRGENGVKGTKIEEGGRWLRGGDRGKSAGVQELAATKADATVREGALAGDGW